MSGASLPCEVFLSASRRISRGLRAAAFRAGLRLGRFPVDELEWPSARMAGWDAGKNERVGEGSPTMRRWFVGWLPTVTLLGCIGPEETQYLSCIPRPASIEARAYDWHDPFPDENAGPDTVSRPRSFLEPRSDPRKAYDLRFFSALHPHAGRAQVAPGPRWPGHGAPGMVAQPGMLPAYDHSPLVVPPLPREGPIAVSPAVRYSATQYPAVVPH